MRSKLFFAVLGAASMMGGNVLVACTGGDDNATPGNDLADSGGVDATQQPHPNDASASDGSVDAGHDATVTDANVADTNVPDTNVADTNVADTNPPVDAGPLGSQTNPASSCKALAAADAGSNTYYVTATGNVADEFVAYCEMTLEGGGWTKVTSAVPEAQVRALLGASGKQMVKCTDNGSEYFTSPSFIPEAPVDGGTPDASANDAGAIPAAWSWAVNAFIQVPGTWRANGNDVACSNNSEYTQYTSCSWWGVGCGDGPGGNNKFFPGVLDSPSAGFCAMDTTSGHTNGGMSICGSNNFRTYSVFVRAD